MDDLACDGGADPPAAHEQAAVDEFGDRAPDRGAGQVQALGEREFVLERISRSQRAVLDGRGELLRELVI